MAEFSNNELPAPYNPTKASQGANEKQGSPYCASGDYYFDKGFEHLESNNNDEAVKMFEVGSKQNHVLCQKYFAMALLTGKGVQKNSELGWKLLLKCAYEKEWDSECTFNEMDPMILQQKDYKEAWIYLKDVKQEHSFH